MICDFLYEDRESSREPLSAIAQYLNPPKVFRHGIDELVAAIPKQEGGDGHDVEVYECRMPATFYKVVAKEGVNSCGQRQEAFTLSTGSGMGELAAQIAIAIAEGMLEIR